MKSHRVKFTLCSPRRTPIGGIVASLCRIRGAAMRSVTRIVGAAAVGLAAVAATAQEKKVIYPETKTVDVVDDYHGTKVPDPYRWLETDVRESKDVAEWVAAQNKVTNQFLESIPERPTINKRITDLWNFERFTAPAKEGGKYFFTKNDGLQNQN